MQKTVINIIRYPNSLQSAVYGLQEMLLMANKVQSSSDGELLECHIHDVESLKQSTEKASVIILPPCNDAGDYYLHPDPWFVEYLNTQYESGCLLASACAGAFILAAAGCLDDKNVYDTLGASIVVSTTLSGYQSQY